MESLLNAISQMEYLHVLLNPLPVYGLLVGEAALIVALLWKSRAAEITALLIVLVSALSVLPVAASGERAYDRVLSLADADGEVWLNAHAARADRAVIAYYILVAIALAALLLPWKKPGMRFPLAIMATLMGVVALGFGGWVAYAGGRVRHKEFRLSPPPIEEAKKNKP